MYHSRGFSHENLWLLYPFLSLIVCLIATVNCPLYSNNNHFGAKDKITSGFTDPNTVAEANQWACNGLIGRLWESPINYLLFSECRLTARLDRTQVTCFTPTLAWLQLVLHCLYRSSRAQVSQPPPATSPAWDWPSTGSYQHTRWRKGGVASSHWQLVASGLSSSVYTTQLWGI